MQEVYAASRGEGLVAGIIFFDCSTTVSPSRAKYSEPGEVFLCLAVRDDEEQPEQFTLDAPTGRHDRREKSLGSVRAVGPAVVLPVRFNLFLCLVVAGRRMRVRMA